MRTFGSLTLAIVGALAFEIAADLCKSALKSSEPSGTFLIAGIYSLIAGVAFFFALAVRGATWAIVLPCAFATALAAIIAILGEPHGWIIAASTLGLTLLMAGLGRLRTEASIPG
jgi:hypothetical protein